jgi:hypothetical protein
VPWAVHVDGAGSREDPLEFGGLRKVRSTDPGPDLAPCNGVRPARPVYENTGRITRERLVEGIATRPYVRRLPPRPSGGSEHRSPSSLPQTMLWFPGSSRGSRSHSRKESTRWHDRTGAALAARTVGLCIGSVFSHSRPGRCCRHSSRRRGRTGCAEFTPSDPAWPALASVSLTVIAGQKDRCLDMPRILELHEQTLYRDYSIALCTWKIPLSGRIGRSQHDSSQAPSRSVGAGRYPVRYVARYPLG